MMRRRRITFGRERNIIFDVPRKRGRLSPLVLMSIVASAGVILLVVAGLLLFPRMGIFAAGKAQQPNTNCTLIVPANPLSAQGLATPYQLTATDPNAGPCNEANTAQSAFVQGVIYDPSTGAFSVYNPLIIDKGTQPAVAPTVPTLPAGAVVALWFGFNANNLLLQGAQVNTLAQAHCTNGLGQSLFSQFSYCHAIAFFAAVNQGIVAHRVQVPALGRAKDGKTCPTVRDFSVVDQDQSDNVQTQYLTMANGQTAQFSAANQKTLGNATVLDNASDNRLLTSFVDPALGCHEWLAPDLADNGNMVPTLALDELQASADQQAPIALVPLNDPMTTVGANNTPSLEKTNLYRLGVDQIPAGTDQEADGATYCKNLLQTGVPRLVRDKPLTIKAPSPDTGAANSLFTFLAQRFQASWTNLNCQQLTTIANPVTTKTDANGVVISATFNQADVPPSTISCTANGQVVAGCNGSANINGQTCTFVFDQAKNQIQLTCPTNQ